MKAIYVIGIIALISAMMVTPAAAETWDVYEGDSIQDAINTASDGDTVFVHAGTYVLPSGTFKIWLDKANLTLKGEGADKVTLDGSGDGILIDMGHNGFGSVPAPGCIVEGFTVKNANVGIGVTQKAPNCIIRNNVFEEISITAVSTDASNTTFRSNVMDGGGYALGTIPAATNLTFRDNVVLNQTDDYYGIQVDGSFSTIVNNTIKWCNGAAISLEYAGNCIVTRNNIISNAYAGIELYDAGSGNRIYLNNFVDNGVTVQCVCAKLCILNTIQ